ncbi:site-specific integrase [uncultured Alistipes sp.]|uniref:site-specific integrase n=1 Tax=uncultured Alistipes sp. TaxID=538949 RepID=UPI0025954DC7|nr:site-specific integrase [uncultured Alistipes sp.]
MSVTIEVVCYKSKVLSNNESPLMLRVTKDRKRKYLSIGISVNPAYWDFLKNKPRRNCPDRVQIERIISDKIKVYREQILNYQAENKTFTAVSLVEKVQAPMQARTVEDVFVEQIANLKQQGRMGYALSHQETYHSLLKFNGHLNIYFSDIDTAWLKRYESWLRGQGFSENTIGRRFCTLRVVYNVAIEEKVAKLNHYPFKSYKKVSKLHRATAKRAIGKAEIFRIINYASDRPYVRLAVDLFAFSYYMGGINFVDMAYLTQQNIVEDRLIYIRRKERKMIKLPSLSQAMEIVVRNRRDQSPYLFPILSFYHTTEQ